MNCQSTRVLLVPALRVMMLHAAAPVLAQACYAAEHVVSYILETREKGEIKHGKKDARNLCVSRQHQKLCEMCMLMVSH